MQFPPFSFFPSCMHAWEESERLPAKSGTISVFFYVEKKVATNFIRGRSLIIAKCSFARRLQLHEKAQFPFRLNTKKTSTDKKLLLSPPSSEQQFTPFFGSQKSCMQSCELIQVYKTRFITETAAYRNSDTSTNKARLRNYNAYAVDGNRALV